jgi:hypothetical protein
VQEHICADDETKNIVMLLLQEDVCADEEAKNIVML